MKLKKLFHLREYSKILLYNLFQSSCLNYRKSSIYKRSTLAIENSSLADFKTNLINRTNNPTVNEWKNLRNDLIRLKNVNKVNVDATILGLCNSGDHLDLAKSYVQYLENEDLKPNNATLGRLLRLYYMSSQNELLTSSVQNEVIEIYDKIRKDQKIFDATTCENLIFGVILTDRWKDSLELLDIIKISSTPSVTSYSLVISKLFLNLDDHEIGWKLLNEMIKNQRQPKCEIFINYFQAIETRPCEFKNNLEKMFEFIGHNDIYVSRKVLSQLRQSLDTLKIRNLVTAITKHGQCEICQNKLGSVSITDNEFKKLSSLFLEKVLIRKDVFLKSTPQEVETFIQFMNKAPKYDCVIDGLNVAYSNGRKSSPKTYVQLLVSVVRHFINKNKRVLVLGRKHMHRWPKPGMDYIKRNADIFFTNDLSHDDPFLLFATLKSGPKSDFFSRDLMRTHAFLLDFEHKKIFKRWQQEHQYSLVTSTDLGKIIVKEPILYNVQAHKINSTWHIPFKDEYSVNPIELFNVSTTWLCVTI